jgi:hypothetical protein
MNVFTLAMLELRREGREGANNYGTLLLDRAITIRDYILKAQRKLKRR